MCQTSETVSCWFTGYNDKLSLEPSVACVTPITAKYWLEPETELAANYGLNRKELSDIERILGERKDEIIERWKQHHSDKR